MAEWLRANIGTIVVVLILAFVVFLIIRTLIRDRRNGKSFCGGSCGSCGSCPMSGACHRRQEKRQHRKKSQS